MNLTKTGNFSKVLRLRKGIAMLLHKIAIALFWAALVSVAFKAKAARNDDDDIYEMPVEVTFYGTDNCNSNLFTWNILVIKDSGKLYTEIIHLSRRTRCKRNICTVLWQLDDQANYFIASYEVSDTIHGLITVYKDYKPACYATLQSL